MNVSRSVENWHRVLGHCNKNDVLQLESVVNGMKISDKKDFNCETCVMGKQVQVINRKADPRSKAPLEFIHTDLCGPITPVSTEGFRWVISFSCDFSGYVFTYFLKRKSDSVKALEKFLADSAPFGTVKRMRSDGGGEFIGQDFEDLLLERGIAHQDSAPYSPHQNGTIERWWRTVFEMGRCLLIESGVPKEYWPYAVAAATYVRNRCFQQRTKQTPYFLLTGRVPDISNLYVFGSTCYAYDHSAKKLDPRSKKGIFFGYDRQSPAYLVYLPETNSVRRFRCIKCFNELYYAKDDIDNDKLSGDENVDDDQDFVRPPNPTINTGPVVEAEAPVNPVAGDIPDLEEIIPPIPVQTVDDANDDLDAVENVPDPDVQLRGGNDERPRRERRPPAHLHDYDLTDGSDQVNSVVVDHVFTNLDFSFKAANVSVPKTYKQALASPDCQKWKNAMNEEMSALQDNNTFSLVELPPGKTTVSSRWVYALKTSVDGSDIYKARCVAKGYTQVYGSDYFETFSPTAKMTSVRTFMQLAVQNDFEVHQLDVKSAYLNADIDCEIYMTQPEGFSEPGKESLVCKLHKSLYGLKQSGRNWNSMLNETLVNFGCTKSSGDSCVYMITANNKLDGMILIWVDDIIIATDHKKLLKRMKDHLKGKFKMKDMGRISNFLGIRFVQSHSKIEMDQSQYLLSILQKYGMSECKPRSTPCELRPTTTSVKAAPLSENPRVYRELVGSLLYATTCTRPDLSWVVSKLSQHLAAPDSSDWVMLKHVLKYVKGTIDFSLSFTKSTNGLGIHGYSDSDWASSADRRSTTGYYFALHTSGPPVSWKSRKQPTVALSSCEAEYMALSASAQEAVYLITVMKDYLLAPKPVIHSDSQSALNLIENPINHNRTKHIDIRYHFVREKYSAGMIDIRYVPREENVADIMTKAASKQYLTNFHKCLFGC